MVFLDDVAQQKSGRQAPEECKPFSLSQSPRRGGALNTYLHRSSVAEYSHEGFHAMSREARAFDIPARKPAQPHWERCHNDLVLETVGSEWNPLLRIFVLLLNA